MSLKNQKAASPVQRSPSGLLVIIAFATVYIVWGSTYFFIRMAVLGGIPPLVLGAIRFTAAGLLLLAWSAVKGKQIFIWKNIFHAAVSGILLLTIATGVVICSEQTLPSAMVAIMVSSSPIWFVLIDKSHWGINFKSRATITGLVIGFAGVILLFSDQFGNLFTSFTANSKLIWMVLLVLGTIAWSAGSLYSKYKLTSGAATVNTGWQMVAAGLAFIPGCFLHHEFDGLRLQNIPANSWFAVLYLIMFGSIAAFSAYVWLLQVRPATQVSTYAYVNPVIAVILGVFFAGEHIWFIQIAGLAIILGSVLLINLAKYQKEKQVKKAESECLLQPVE